jgi:deferrochelatase/peroxidase EfeB
VTETAGLSGAPDSGAPRAGIGRRSFLGRAAVVGAGAVAAGAAGFGVARATEPDEVNHVAHLSSQVPFYGARQAGIATPAQDRLAFAAFDVRAGVSAEALMQTLGQWAAACARMTSGLEIGATETLPQNPPIDTGEAIGLSPAQLTITVGFGPSLFDDRFGLAKKRPAALADLPPFAGEDLDETVSGGDIGVQACSNDPQVAFHVIRNLARIGRSTVAMRWSQLGFGRTSTTSTSQATPRNLMGFKDGTNNIKLEDTAEMDQFVWVGAETDQAWMQGGSYMITRRIQMHIEQWDADFIADQEKIFGRFRDTGAPLTGKAEFDVVNLSAKDSSGQLVIDTDSHIRLAAPSSHSGVKILRRGYSFTDGQLVTGSLDAGLFFICFNQDPRKQFVPIQSTLAKNDLLNEYIKHTGSALFAVPPGVTQVGDWFGKKLFTG